MTETINVPVAPDVARAFESAKPDEQRRLLALLETVLAGWADQRVTLKEVMDRIGAEAKSKGMTPEILEEILRVQ